VIPSNCSNHNTASVSRHRESLSIYVVCVCVCLYAMCVHIIHRMALQLLLIIHITSWLRLEKFKVNWGLLNIIMNDSLNNKFGMDSFSLRAYGMHLAWTCRLVSLLSLFCFVLCLCRTGVRSLLYRFQYFTFFDCNFQISNHRPFSRLLSYKKYFTYYTGCMFTISVLILLFYVFMLSRCSPP